MTRENLVTRGGEFNLPNGTSYTGKYHVHVTDGAMVGAKHSRYRHDSLKPATLQASKKVVGIMRELQEEKQEQARAIRPRGTSAQRARRNLTRGQGRRQIASRRTSSRPSAGRSGGGGY